MFAAKKIDNSYPDTTVLNTNQIPVLVSSDGIYNTEFCSSEEYSTIYSYDGVCPAGRSITSPTKSPMRAPLPSPTAVPTEKPTAHGDDDDNDNDNDDDNDDTPSPTPEPTAKATPELTPEPTPEPTH